MCSPPAPAPTPPKRGRRGGGGLKHTRARRRLRGRRVHKRRKRKKKRREGASPQRRGGKRMRDRRRHGPRGGELCQGPRPVQNVAPSCRWQPRGGFHGVNTGPARTTRWSYQRTGRLTTGGTVPRSAGARGKGPSVRGSAVRRPPPRNTHKPRPPRARQVARQRGKPAEAHGAGRGLGPPRPAEGTTQRAINDGAARARSRTRWRTSSGTSARRASDAISWM